MSDIHISSSRVTFNLILFCFFKSISLLTNMNTLQIPHPLNLALEGVTSNHLPLIPGLVSLKCSRKTQTALYISCHITNLLKNLHVSLFLINNKKSQAPLRGGLCFNQVMPRADADSLWQISKRSQKKPGILNEISLFLSLR